MKIEGRELSLFLDKILSEIPKSSIAESYISQASKSAMHNPEHAEEVLKVLIVHSALLITALVKHSEDITAITTRPVIAMERRGRREKESTESTRI